MPRKRSQIHANRRVAKFELELEKLLATNEFRSFEQLFKSRRFKMITLRESKRPQGDAEKRIPLDAFFKTAKERCRDNANSKANRICLMAFRKDDKKPKKHGSRSGAETSEVPAKVTEKKQAVEQQPKENVQRGEVLALGLNNFGKTCYAASSWQLLSGIDLFFVKLEESRDASLQIKTADQNNGLICACYEFLREKQSGCAAKADSAFFKVLKALGALLPRWSDFDATQDCNEYINVLIGCLQDESSLVGVDIGSALFGCEMHCEICTLEQSATSVVRRGYLQAHTVKTTSDVLREALEENSSICAACSSECLAMSSLPKNILIRINRFDADMKAFPGSRLVAQEEVQLLNMPLSGSYSLRAAVLFHQRKQSIDHYTTVVHHPQSQSWLNFDDEVVSRLSQTAAFSLINKKAYMLLFTLTDHMEPPQN